MMNFSKLITDISPISIQLIKEFTFPFLLASIWTLYNIHTAREGESLVKIGLNVFGTTFFFMSWFFAQIFRVKKQKKVESGLSEIEASVRNTLKQLDEKTKDLVGYLTGGDNFIKVFLIEKNTLFTGGEPRLGVSISNEGKYPMFDIVIDIQELGGAEKVTTRFEIGNLSAWQGKSIGSIDLPQQEPQLYHIEIRSRNGHRLQISKVVKNEKGKLVYKSYKIYADAFNPVDLIYEYPPVDSSQ